MVFIRQADQFRWFL